MDAHVGQVLAHTAQHPLHCPLSDGAHCLLMVHLEVTPPDLGGQLLADLRDIGPAVAFLGEGDLLAQGLGVPGEYALAEPANLRAGVVDVVLALHVVPGGF